MDCGQQVYRIEIGIEISVIVHIFHSPSMCFDELDERVLSSHALRRRVYLPKQKITYPSHCPQKPVTCSILRSISQHPVVSRVR